MKSFFKKEKKSNESKENKESDIFIDYENCIGEDCQKCVIACPNKVFDFQDNLISPNNFWACKTCHICESICPKDCIKLN
ncbi:ferredoxin family protein [uncultured Methanobrevibacter sp.]|uniref:4Fe-4S dicluster domain-containing protein n=1 Tax=uncultured Methanobrevibacter sp. TaxID=253161 RepID=UPI0025F148EE|nr:4Fe-4S dicluster domain-containing protein [uncultured Methanobrevibacter sp.]